jgi:hypothetical protein
MFALLLVLAQTAGAPADAGALLNAAGERHFALQAYSVEIRQQRFNPGVSMSSGRFGIHRDDNGRWRIEMDKASFAVGTGESWHVYAGQRRTYYTAESGPGVRYYKDLAYRTVGRFEKLGMLAGGARFLRWESLKRELKTHRCAVVELRSGAEEEAKWVELLWIDPEERLVLRSNFEFFGLNRLPGPSAATPTGAGRLGVTGAGMPGVGLAGLEWLPTEAGTIVTDYHWRRLDAPESEELFQFVPPKGARRVDPPQR